MATPLSAPRADQGSVREQQRNSTYPSSVLPRRGSTAQRTPSRSSEALLSARCTSQRPVVYRSPKLRTSWLAWPDRTESLQPFHESTDWLAAGNNRSSPRELIGRDAVIRDASKYLVVHSPVDFQYLSEALDALDRLYDGESGARDVLAILRVVGLALNDRNLGDRISEVAEQLNDTIRAALPNLLDKESTLKVTDQIRIPTADAWAEFDAQRNPRSTP